MLDREREGSHSSGCMHGLGRWHVVHRTRARARRTLAVFGAALKVPAGATVLELGLGGGGMLAEVWERDRPGQYLGTDLDPRQLEAARTYLTHRWGQILSGVELAPADARALPYPSGSFDVVLAFLVLHHVEARHAEFVERPRALAEIRRVLRPGGVLAYSEFSQREATRATLAELGFRFEFRRCRWRTEYAIARGPTAPS